MFSWLLNCCKPKEKKPDREWMIWVGDGIAPAGPDLIGCKVNIEGRKGVIVDTTLLKVCVEWEPNNG